MSAATSPGTGLGLRPAQRVCAAWGMARVLRHDLRPARQAAAGKASGTEARDLGPGAAGGDRSRPGGIALGGRGLPQGLGSASGLSRHPGCPQAGAPPDAREQSALAPSLPPAVAAIPMTVRSSLMPRTSCGAPMAFGCSRWTTAGAGSSPPSSSGTPSVSAGMSASAATASPPCSRSPWGLPGCMARPRPARLGGWPCGWITWAPSICRTTSPTRSSSGASSRPTPSSPEPQTSYGVAERFNRTLKEQIIHGRIYRNIAELRDARPRLRRTLQCPVDRRKERLPEPRSSSSGVARRDLNQARRVRQTCVQGTGFATNSNRHHAFSLQTPQKSWLSKPAPLS